MNFDRNMVDAIARLSEVAAVDAARDLQAPVRACPGWTNRDLVEHIARVQQLWAAGVSQRCTDKSTMTPPPTKPDNVDAVAWLRTSSAALVAALRDCPDDQPLWTWWPPQQHAAFVRRRQLNEIVIHGWDARDAVGDPRPIDTNVALVGLDEFVEIFSKDLVDGATPPPQLALSADDADWSAAMFAESSDATTPLQLRGPASTLLLQLWRRLPVDDPAVAAALASIDLS